ncbi:cyclopropane-fatty-acyl-phospholipid synthase family protein [Tessaracoccus sp. MC1756]|uniref:SAM-dependent methyltransferase n=1 Tax=Tessaracoccus sp. MC1756 TaxID=2760311 RepID=UPI001602FD7A|nr:cyclopropane-fatty-acyl-phospholipid synthase family protein [Tessaracoccus sp. MC1756]MBB1510797.1 class I SAM-dependent methyltransferase [Tessaracoccus sp. MC1756]
MKQNLNARMPIADAVASLLREGMPLRFTASDGSATGPEDSDLGLALRTRRGLAYLVTAPGELGMVRAYLAGDLELRGVHPGDPYEILKLVQDRVAFRLPSAPEALELARALGIETLKPPPPPPLEYPPRWRRLARGLRHSKARDSDAISHHYDVSNTFYEHILGPSMTYTCAVYPSGDATLEEAQAEKYDLICRKLGLRAGMRLLDVGCGWGGMVRHAAKHYGVRSLGVTLSHQQALWATDAIAREGLGGLAEVRHGDYRDVTESGFDAVSSIGLTEHIGVKNYPAYFAFLRDRLRPEGRLLNHCITHSHNRREPVGPFLDRYIFPDGEMSGSGVIIRDAQDAGFEVMHEENFRPHYALTLAAWCRNLVDHWDACVAEVGETKARAWGLYMAGSRLSFERNHVQLHHVLAVRATDDGTNGFPLRLDW